MKESEQELRRFPPGEESTTEALLLVETQESQSHLSIPGQLLQEHHRDNDLLLRHHVVHQLHGREPEIPGPGSQDRTEDHGDQAPNSTREG